MDKIIAIFILIAALSMCDKKTTAVTSGPAGSTTTTTVTSIGATSFVKRVIGWLRIADLVKSLLEGEEKVIVEVEKREVVFYPVAFANRNGIDSELMAVKFDERLEDILRECTQRALDTGISDHVRLREVRIQCLEQKGFDENDKTYIHIKHPSYWT